MKKAISKTKQKCSLYTANLLSQKTIFCLYLIFTRHNAIYSLLTFLFPQMIISL
uniref:Uncharacterized protein n=1 Tax=Anguilla anguilla TaxID=7936 RepID=A0A0E9T7C1_ANGAN